MRVFFDTSALVAAISLDRRDFPRLARELAGRIRVPPAIHGAALPS